LGSDWISGSGCSCRRPAALERDGLAVEGLRRQAPAVRDVERQHGAALRGQRQVDDQAVVVANAEEQRAVRIRC
jgi:hypothetical protein